MAIGKTSIRIEPELWERCQRASELWARRKGLRPGRKRSEWVARALEDACAAEEKDAAGHSRDTSAR